MRPSQHIFIALIFVLSTPAFSQEDVADHGAGDNTAGGNIALPDFQGRPACNTDQQALQASMAQYQQQLRQKIISHPMARQVTNGEELARALTQCAEKMQNMITACSPAQLNSQDCLKANVLRGGHVVSAPGRGSFREDPMFMASTMASEANCIRSVGACLRYGSRRTGAESNQTTQAACINDLRARLGQFNNSSDPSQVVERAFIQAAERFHQQITTRALAPVAECRDKEGQTAEQQARQFLETAKAANASGSAAGALDCVDRQASSRYCIFSRDGSRVTQIPEDQEGEHARRGGLSTGVSDTGCTTSVLGTSPTGQQHVSTAGHCLRPGQDSTRVMIHDRNGQPVWREASSCQRQFTTTAGSERDLAVCRIDQPVDVAPRRLATLNPLRTGNDCAPRSQDYVLECGPGFYQRLSDSGTEVRATFYSPTTGMTESRGRLFYDSANNLLYHDMVMPRGSSGAQFYVNVPGMGPVPIDVAAQSWSAERANYGFGTVIRTDEFMRLRGDPSTDQLRVATALFDDFRHTH